MAKVLEFTDDSGWLIMCPACGNGHKFVKGRWTFNGDFDRPTFNPSMLVQGALRPGVEDGGADGLYGTCHSFVRDGKIEFLGDCTHALAGQTVELEDV